MLYVIYCDEASPGTVLRRDVGAAHRNHLEALREAGRLILAGPCPAVDCSDPGPLGYGAVLVVAEFDSLDDARDWANLDPLVASGTFARIEVRPFVRHEPIGEPPA